MHFEVHPEYLYLFKHALLIDIFQPYDHQIGHSPVSKEMQIMSVSFPGYELNQGERWEEGANCI